MAMTTDDILIAIRADNSDLKAKLNDVNRRLSGVDDNVRKNQKGFRSLRDTVGQFGTMVKTFLLVQLGRLSARMVELTGKIDSVRSTYKSLTASVGGDSNKILQSMRKASRGMVSDLDLMQTTSEAIKLMGEDVVQQLPKMAEIARAAARSSGEDVTKMLNDLVTATGRQSVQILDNIGISSATASKYMDQYAATLGKTRQQMTDAERKAAFFHAAMKAGQEIIDASGADLLTWGERIQQVKTMLKNFRDTILNQVVTGFNRVSDAMSDLGVNMEMMKSVGIAIGNVFNVALTGIANMIRRLKIEILAIEMLYYQIRGRLARDQAARDKWESKYIIARGKRADQLIKIIKANEDMEDMLAGNKERMTAGGFVPGTGKGGKNADEPGAGGQDKDGWNPWFDAERVKQDLEKIQQSLVDSYNPIQSLGNAFQGLEDASRQATYDMLWGEGGWKNFQKNMGEIFKKLVADLAYYTAKVIAMKVAVAAISGGTGGGAGVLASIFEKGRVPSYQNGRIPAYPTGRVPDDHFLAYIGAREAVMTKEASLANADILKAMNSSGQRYGGEQTINMNIPLVVDGREIGRVSERYMVNQGKNSGRELYHRKSVYK